MAALAAAKDSTGRLPRVEISRHPAPERGPSGFWFSQKTDWVSMVSLQIPKGTLWGLLGKPGERAWHRVKPSSLDPSSCLNMGRLD